MSRYPETDITCPNCGHHTTLNYCAQCGQETHLHKETFWGLIMHFVGHYFHYDSKFWKTMKMLIAKPGGLTVAYWNKQRARHIPPISLYIFISSLFFLSSYLLAPTSMHQLESSTMGKKADSVLAARQLEVEAQIKADSIAGRKTSLRKRQFNSMKEMEVLVQKVQHNLPKVYFFLVPFLALLLRILLAGRRELYYVDHAIYSLHFHTAAFLILMMQSACMAIMFIPVVSLLCYLLLIVYSVAALRHAYKLTTGVAVFFTFVLGFLYTIASLVVSFGIMLIYNRDELMALFGNTIIG